MKSEFDAYVNAQTQYIAEAFAQINPPENFGAVTAEQYADSLTDKLLTEIESSSFSGGMARELAYEFMNAVDFSQIADRMMEEA